MIKGVYKLTVSGIDGNGYQYISGMLEPERLDSNGFRVGKAFSVDIYHSKNESSLWTFQWVGGALRNVSASKPAKRSLNARVTYLREMVKELNAQREKAEAERDALLEIAKNGKDCDTCKNCAVCVKPGTDVAHWCDRCEEKCRCYGCGGDHWEWRGLPEEPEGGEKA